MCPLNFIAEIRAFYDWLQFNSLPADAQALWHSLMYLNNRCAVFVNGSWAWRVEFTVSNTTLLSILKFSRQQLDRMRNALIQAGRIEYKKGRGNQCGTYKIIPFDANNVTHSVTQTDTHSGTQTVTQVWQNQGTLINSNTNTQFNNDDGDDYAHTRETAGDESEKKTPLQLFSKYFGKSPTQAEASQCRLWIDTVNVELVEYAFFRASVTDNKNAAYVGGILKKLKERGIRDMGALANYDMDHEKGR